MRRLSARQWSAVAPKRRLRPRRFDSLVKGEPKLRSEPVSFGFLACDFIQISSFLMINLPGLCIDLWGACKYYLVRKDGGVLKESQISLLCTTVSSTSGT